MTLWDVYNTDSTQGTQSCMKRLLEGRVLNEKNKKRKETRTQWQKSK